MLQEGFDRRAQEMQEEISNLQREQAAAEKRAQEQNSGGILGAILRPVIEIAVDVLGGRVLRGIGALGAAANAGSSGSYTPPRTSGGTSGLGTKHA